MPAPSAAAAGESEVLAVADHGSVRRLTFQRPDRLNAWTQLLEDAYFDALLEADADPAIRAIVVTGAGRGFCSGADLDDLGTVGSLDAADLMRGRPLDLPLMIRKPVIGAINGVAAGLGLVEALYCDIRFGGPDTRFITAFARRGLIAEYGVSWMLQRLVGPSRAADLLLSSRPVDATEAFRIGLLDHLVDDADVVGRALAYASDLATWCSPTSMAVIKGQLARDGARDYPHARTESSHLMIEAFRRPELAEGIASHRERRPPRFAPLSAPGGPVAQGISTTIWPDQPSSEHETSASRLDTSGYTERNTNR